MVLIIGAFPEGGFRALHIQPQPLLSTYDIVYKGRFDDIVYEMPVEVFVSTYTSLKLSDSIYKSTTVIGNHESGYHPKFEINDEFSIANISRDSDKHQRKIGITALMNYRVGRGDYHNGIFIPAYPLRYLKDLILFSQVNNLDVDGLEKYLKELPKDLDKEKLTREKKIEILEKLIEFDPNPIDLNFDAVYLTKRERMALISTNHQ